MIELDIEALKKVELDILSFIHDFCEKNDIKYSLCGGTLLGAVRHKGFIPWDDDIDIFMLRDQYEKFISLMENNDDDTFKLITYKNSKNYNLLFAKVVDKRTILIEDHFKKVNDMGVYVDIFPIDSLADSVEESKKKLKKSKFKKFIGVASNWRHFYINKNSGFLRQIPRFIFYIASRFKNPKKGYLTIEKQFPYDNNLKYFGVVCGVYNEKEIMLKETFDFSEYLEFEGRKFCVIKDYKTYLTSLYGNYMELPPVEKRVAHHTFKAYFKE